MLTGESTRTVAVAKEPTITRTGAAGRTGVVLGGLLLLISLAILSLFVGSGDISWSATWHSLTNRGDTTADVIVWDYRIPRTLLAMLVGAGLGLAGVVIQAVTRNPLADPGILGVNAGAFLAVALGAAYFDVTATAGQVWWAIGGSMVAALVVYLVGMVGRGGATPIRLVLTGVALGAVFTGISTSVTLSNPDVFDRLRFWAAGSLQGRQMDTVTAVLPFIAVGLVVVVLLARSLNLFALGGDLARALGARVTRITTISFIAITALCGASTAAAGPITFFGLLVPFLARLVIGPDMRWVIVVSLIFAPALFLAADMLGRVLVPSELPVGVVTAFVGAPLLIVLVRRKTT